MESEVKDDTFGLKFRSKWFPFSSFTYERKEKHKKHRWHCILGPELAFIGKTADFKNIVSALFKLTLGDQTKLDITHNEDDSQWKMTSKYLKVNI